MALKIDGMFNRQGMSIRTCQEFFYDLQHTMTPLPSIGKEW